MLEMKIDHLMWACSDLQHGIDEIADLTGIVAEPSGSHPGLGTCNALMSLGADSYLEIIAPDTSQALTNNFGERLANLKSTGLLSWAVTATNLGSLANGLLEQGIDATSPKVTERESAQGRLTWELMFVTNLNGAPFFIDWLDCVHPALTSPQGCELVRLDIEVDAVDRYQKSFGGIQKLNIKKGGSNPNAVLRAGTKEITLTPLAEKVRLF